MQLKMSQFMIDDDEKMSLQQAISTRETMRTLNSPFYQLL